MPITKKSEILATAYTQLILPSSGCTSFLVTGFHNVAATNGKGLRLLHSAVAKGHDAIARLLLSDSSLERIIEKLCRAGWPARYESIVAQNEDLRKPLPKSICEAKFSDEMGAVCGLSFRNRSGLIPKRFAKEPVARFLVNYRRLHICQVL